MKTYRVTIVLKDKLAKGVEVEDNNHQAITVFVKAKDVFSAKTKAMGAIKLDVWEEQPIDEPNRNWGYKDEGK